MSRFLTCFFLILTVSVLSGCNSYQPVKNVWKTTKGLWNEYVSPPAQVDYEAKGELPPQAEALSKSMMGIDSQLIRLERVMQNADKPPTQDWVNKFFADFPWLNGFAGVKYDGTILGMQPPDSMKDLDFIPLLYEDKKQNSRALRTDVMPSALGPEIMLAAPLYDGIDFLGIVVAYFDMRNLMQYSSSPQDMVILAPEALLWPGKYEFAATPLAGVDWKKVVRESSAGTCKNANGSFFYLVRYLGNMPLVFAIAESGSFPEGNGSLEQGLAFFPQEREKLPPPPMPERKNKPDIKQPAFMAPGESEAEPELAENSGPVSGDEESSANMARAAASPASDRSNEIKPGSRESVLLKGGKRNSSQIQERSLEGDNVQVELVERPRRPSSAARPLPEPSLGLIPDDDMETLPGGRPSPFGPKQEAAPRRPSPFGPPAEQAQDTAPEAAGTDEPLADGESVEKRTLPEASANTPLNPEQKKTAKSEGISPDEPLADGEKIPSSKANDEKATQETGDATGAKNDTETKSSDENKDASSSREPAFLPGGRPSPFGPRN